MSVFQLTVMNIRHRFFRILRTLAVTCLLLAISCSRPESTLALRTDQAFEKDGKEERSFACDADESIRIWFGKVGEYDLCWTAEDFVSRRQERRRTYFTEYAKKWYLERRSGLVASIYEVEFAITSIVGPVVSIEVHETLTSAAGGGFSSQMSWITVDLRRDKPIGLSYEEHDFTDATGNLSTFFSESAILASLLSNPTVKASLKGRRLKVHTLSDLLSLNLITSAGQLEGYAMNKFHLDAIHGKSVTVSLELLDLYNVHQGEIKSLSLNLPLKDALDQQQLLDAFNCRSGFMFSKRAHSIATRTTKLHFVD